MIEDSQAGIKRMLADIEAETRLTRGMIGKDRLDERVMDAMARVPRDAFVPDGLRSAAFDNGPLPIGHGQTISQPYIVALMTDLLGLAEEAVVLEVGTGSGYQAAVLSLLCRKVYSMDLIPSLVTDAGALLDRLGYDNVILQSGNGYDGWPEHAPYDGIIVTAAATHIPQALVDQLKPGARLVVPVGLPYMPQELLVVAKDADGESHVRDVLAVAFVPLVEDAERHGG
jgi:protein-L-isoaspartate(D-aspartate) O-methyltransferase